MEHLDKLQSKEFLEALDVWHRMMTARALMEAGWQIDLFAQNRKATDLIVHKAKENSPYPDAFSYPLEKNLQLALETPKDPSFERFMRVDRIVIPTYRDHVHLYTYWRPHEPACKPRERFKWHPAFDGQLHFKIESTSASAMHGLQHFNADVVCRKMILVLRSPAWRRWRRVAAMVKMRIITLYWQERTLERTCAPGGACRARDLVAFVGDGVFGSL